MLHAAANTGRTTPAGLSAVENQAHGHGADGDLPPYGRRIRDLKAWFALDRLARGQTCEPARGAVDHIDTQGLELLAQDDGVIQAPAASEPWRCKN